MPYHINTVAPGKFEVVDDAGKVAGTHPTRKQALAQLKALYANVPEAKKEIDETLDLTDEQADAFEVDEAWVDSILLDEDFKSFSGDRERKAAFASMADERGGGYRIAGLSSVKKAIDEIKFQREALKKGGYGNDTKGDKRAISRNYKRSVNRLKTLIDHYEGDGYSGGIGALKKAGIKEMITDKATADINNLPDSAFLYVESGGEKDEGGKTVPRSLRHLPYKTQDGGIDLPKLRNALSRLGQSATGTTGGERWLTEGVRKSLVSKAQKILADNTDAESAKPEKKEAPPSILDRVIAALRGDVTEKEGRRNSTPDGDRLQQIHDLAVLNGASCPMVMKEASGKLRWVLLSSNAFIDSDKEIISTKALEADVARTDKAAAPYGPLRWWHMGAPDPIALSAGSGADIGDCDYRAMSGRVLIESGTFRNERIGEAIKERANTLAGSIGFFHPKDEPDSEGVYRNVVTFERSLLPRGKASNQLTALTVKGEESMATSKEKQDALAALLGDQSLAESVIKQAEATEKAADDRGLKYKEQDKPAEAAPEVEATTKAPTGEPTAVPAHGESGLMKAFGLSPDDDEATCKEKIGKVLNAMMEAKMAASAKETAEKEAGLNSKIAALETSVKELMGDVPRGLQSGFRASIADATILKDINFKNAPTGDPLDSVIDQLMGVKK